MNGWPSVRAKKKSSRRTLVRDDETGFSRLHLLARAQGDEIAIGLRRFRAAPRRGVGAKNLRHRFVARRKWDADSMTWLFQPIDNQ